jgi:hypothetical protein
MAISKKMLDALKQDRKRRTHRPAGPPPELKAPRKLEDRMISDHQDVLENIEVALVTAFWQLDFVDDKLVAGVLRCAIQQTDAEDEETRVLLRLLVHVGELREDVDDATWTNCLRVVYTSVRRHSACRAGDTDYLDFVEQYVK